MSKRALSSLSTFTRQTSIPFHRYVRYQSTTGGGSGAGGPGKSPFAVFVEVLKEEIAKSREWQDNIKQLQGEAQKVQDAEAMKKAREVYERARLTSSIRENPRLRAAAEELRKAGGKVGDAVNEAMDAMAENKYIKGGREAVQKASQAVSSAVLTATEPVRNTETYKEIASHVNEAVDDALSNTRYGGFVEKETRRRRREERLRKLGKGEGGLAARRKVEANPDAGHALVWKPVEEKPTISSRIADMTPRPVADMFSKMSTSFQESDNSFIATVRSISHSLGRITEETETAKVVKWVKTLDPNFRMEEFTKELREYIVPEIVDAFIQGDLKTLKQWCSEGTYNVLTASIQPYLQRGLISDSRVLDIRGVDVMSAKVLEEKDVPVFIISFRTQEILAFRNPKTGEVVEGDEHSIDQCGYVMIITRVEEELDNEMTGGWKVIDIARRSQKAYL
ncbi:TIM44 subunit of mitochondria import inner membrane translocase [Atractiella rhizophila]|nr:TIM44 subunit of mitochondria import inner membrane translocase [Atractiella rhizophila]